jgi:polysaccharide pyruvyl transferase WcaK-like protein
VLSPEAGAAEVLGALGAADAVLSMRLHASLLAHRLGTPAVGLAYDPKVHEHYRELELAERSLPLSAGADEIAAAVAGALALEGTIGPEVTARVSALEARAQEALERLARALDQAPPVALPEDGRAWLAPPLSPSRAGAEAAA